MTAKTWLAAIGCACSLVAGAMPTQKELKKVERLVYELMRSDIADFNARKKSATDVAASAVKYADEAKSEASRFLLLKGAFIYSVRGEDYDGAMKIISKLRDEIADVPDKTLVKLFSDVLRQVSRKNAGRLYNLYQHLQNRIRYAQEATDFAAKLKTRPSNKSLHTALGERYALLGEWNKALAEFAIGTSPAAKAVVTERRTDAKPSDIADAWWKLSETSDTDAMLAYRARAIKFYRRALASGSLDGLMKTVVKQRIEDFKTIGAGYEEYGGNETAILIGIEPGKVSIRPKPLVFDLGEDVKMEMVGCPNGIGALWPDTNCIFEITRPFWFGKYPVTMGEWNRLMPPVALPPGMDRKNSI